MMFAESTTAAITQIHHLPKWNSNKRYNPIPAAVPAVHLSLI